MNNTEYESLTKEDFARMYEDAIEEVVRLEDKLMELESDMADMVYYEDTCGCC